MGYAGGTREDPTYYSLGDHTETLEIQYDPQRITYGELLDVFWGSHNPIFEPLSRQYMSIIFYRSPEQEMTALESRAQREAALNSKIYTEIIPLKVFYPAEDYHQKYYLQNTDLWRELQRYYKNIEDLVASTAAARINGYLGGYGDSAALESVLPSLGLSPEGMERLKKRVR